MKNNWILISIIIGIIGGIIAYLFVQNWKLALIVTVLIFAVSLLFNPKLFFARLSLYGFSMLVSLNKFFFEATGQLLGVEFTLKNDTAFTTTTIIIGIITIISLIFYFLERNGKLKGTILDFSKNNVSIGYVSDSDIDINQTINKK